MSSENRALLEKTLEQAAETYFQLNQELMKKVNSLTSSKLKSVILRSGMYPLPIVDGSKMTNQENEAYELACKIKEVYVDLFLMKAQLKALTEQEEQNETK